MTAQCRFWYLKIGFLLCDRPSSCTGPLLAAQGDMGQRCREGGDTGWVMKGQGLAPAQAPGDCTAPCPSGLSGQEAAA